MPIWDSLPLLSDHEFQRAAMAAWHAAFGIGGGVLLGYRLDRALVRVWQGQPPPWYPVDGATWAGLVVGVWWVW